MRRALALLLLAGCTRPTSPPDVVLISLDTVRADALSCYGSARASTPAIDQLAAQAVRFAQVYSSAPNTAPSHATMFTGLAPFAHRVANASSLEAGTPALAPELETLAESFGAAGYETAAFTDDGPLGDSWNLLQGFEQRRARYEDIADKLDDTISYLEQRDALRPLFLFLHTYQAHQPYLPPVQWEQRFAGSYTGPLRERVAELRAQPGSGSLENTGRALMSGRESFDAADTNYLHGLYLAEVAYTDSQLGRLFDALRARARWESSVLCLTSDHGEEFGEHGQYGHTQLYSETLRVPWIMKLANDALAGTEFLPRVCGLDLYSTLLDSAGLEAARGVEQRSLLPFVEANVAPDRPAFANTNEHLFLGESQAPFRRSVRHKERSLVLNRPSGGGPDRIYLFDLSTDPRELHPLDVEDAEERFKLGELQERIAQHLERATAQRIELSGAAEMHLSEGDVETMRQLQALGYLDPEVDSAHSEEPE